MPALRKKRWAQLVIKKLQTRPVTPLSAAILNTLQRLAEDDASGNLLIIEPGRIRLRETT